MKIRYKYKIVISFVVILLGVVLLFMLLIFSKENQMKVERLIYAMQPYTDIIYQHSTKPQSNILLLRSVDSICNTLPYNMRVTLIDSSGKVLLDNFSRYNPLIENHLSRPEIVAAKQNGSGHALRYSFTLDADFLYYAKKYPTLYVRTALDYKENIYPNLQENRSWQIYTLLIFIFSVTTLIYVTQKLSRPYYSLKEFIGRVRDNDDYDEVRFPKDELGEVGEQIMLAFKEMDNSKKFKQQLTHNVAHELKTPVSGIRGYLETILEEEEIDKEQMRFFLERAYAQSLRLSVIINDMAVLNKIEEGKNNFEFEKINLSNCLQEIVNDLSFKLEEKSMRCHINIPQKTEIEGNYLLIYSLFKNLIDNSIDHAGEGVEIYVSELGVSDNQVYLTYYDTGKGVPEDHIHRIFERFYRVEKGRSRRNGGSGLGLSIVKNSVLLHKGKISVSNRQGGGLQVDFTLAIKRSSQGQ